MFLAITQGPYAHNLESDHVCRARNRGEIGRDFTLSCALYRGGPHEPSS